MYTNAIMKWMSMSFGVRILVHNTQVNLFPSWIYIILMLGLEQNSSIMTKMDTRMCIALFFPHGVGWRKRTLIGRQDCLACTECFRSAVGKDVKVGSPKQDPSLQKENGCRLFILRYSVSVSSYLTISLNHLTQTEPYHSKLTYW